MADKKITREYDIPILGWVGIIHDPTCEKGPYYARVGSYGVIAAHSESEDDARVKAGKGVELLLGSRKTELEIRAEEENSGKINLIGFTLSCLKSSQTPLVALDKYETQD